MKLNPQHSCPNCQKTFTVKQLRKKSFSGSLKPYQFTPAPGLHCPHCDQKLRADYVNVHFYWLMGGFIFAILLLIFQALFPDIISKDVSDIIRNLVFWYVFVWHGLKWANSIVYHKADD